MGVAIATNAVEVHGVGHPTPAEPARRIAGLVGPFEHLEALAAQLEHFGHERQALQLPSVIQRRQNFFFAEDLDPIASSES